MKKAVSVFVITCMFASLFLWSNNAQATVVTTTMNLLRSVSVLGVSVTPSGGAKFVFFDNPNATTTQYYNLPALSGLNGQIYILKGAGMQGYPVEIRPADGEKIEGITNQGFIIGDNPGEYFQFVADENNDTWWITGNGYSGYVPES